MENRITDRAKVLKIYDTAICSRLKIHQWRVYYSWITNQGTRMHQLLGIGRTRTQAWKSAWRAIQLTMLSKFESGIEVG